MGSTRRSFTDEYKRDAVSLILDGGHTIGEVAKKLEISETSISKWVKKIQPQREPAWWCGGRRGPWRPARAGAGRRCRAVRWPCLSPLDLEKRLVGAGFWRLRHVGHVRYVGELRTRILRHGTSVRRLALPRRRGEKKCSGPARPVRLPIGTGTGRGPTSTSCKQLSVICRRLP